LPHTFITIVHDSLVHLYYIPQLFTHYLSPLSVLCKLIRVYDLGSGYRTACGSSYLKPYSIATCNMTVMHDESVVGLVET